ncbi:sortase-associated OmpA-like protein PdsO [Shewanella sp. Scap07]|uniref:sortase-associated OmpA-like protein PdsO n=1 Tax=Shewanella sp. Scap07 TaxID=2589987 RepID=UPI0015B87D17|nr:sortase-associated OmpA-like protein PdsO [Shewanella sp. Scap07]QLE85368.1 sortase-associated OmpA-like protein PdsO [Shewanella sp. Scap07]
MKKQLLSALIISSVTFSQASFAEQAQEPETRSHNEELIGLSSGIVLGAVVGGPVGAIIGAFTGTIIGKSVGDESELKSNSAQLAMQQDEIANLAAEKQRLAANQQQTKQQLVALKQAQSTRLAELTLGLNVQFKTGSSEIQPHFQAQLDEVAYLLNQSPSLRLDLTGYADRRGDSTYNQALSEQRAAEVRGYLVNKGVEVARLDTSAFGASSPLNQEQNFENDFFDRRVTLRLVTEETAVAANH